MLVTTSLALEIKRATVLCRPPSKTPFPAFSGSFPLATTRIACLVLPVLTARRRGCIWGCSSSPQRCRGLVQVCAINLPKYQVTKGLVGGLQTNSLSTPRSGPGQPKSSLTSCAGSLGGAHPLTKSSAWGFRMRARIGWSCTSIAGWCIAPNSLWVV